MSIQDHLNQPELSIGAHFAARRAGLEASLAGKAAIYLDTRFWIMVREVEDGTSNRDDEREIVRLLRTLAEQGRAFCPIAEPTFSEVMRQAQPDRRAATASAIDELSFGVTILPDWERMVEEVRSLLAGRLRNGTAPPPPRAFTSLAYVLGDLYPTHTGFPAAEELAIQKAFYDHLWCKPLAEMVLAIPAEHYSCDDELEETARRLTEQNAMHRHLLTSFAEVLEQEYHGVGLAIAEKVPDLLTSLIPFMPGDSAAQQMVAANAIREMLKDLANARAMPTAHVHATIHSLFRWEYRDRAITANDLVDFRHATAALSHCGLFLTEKGLRNSLLHQRTALADLHGCTVLSSRGEIVRHLRRLVV